jgi:SRSO17 transposase
MTARRDQPPKGFLSGIRVLELSDETGEYIGRLLAGLGADVVKIEPPEGEVTRSYGPFLDDEPDRNKSLYFWHFNFGKRGITLDLDTERDCDRLRRLAKSTDVVIDARPRGYLDDRGIGYDGLRAVNPSLIYSRVTAFGEDGPWADFQGSDLIHLALGGVAMNCGYDPEPGGHYDTPPIAPQMWHAYQINGEVTAIAIMAALNYRLESGVGQYLTSIVHDSVAKSTGLPRVNGWSIAWQGGNQTPDKPQRLLNYASWDQLAAMSAVRQFAVASLNDAARRNRRPGGMRAGVLDETGQEKQGTATEGVKRQYLGCASRVANGINTVHLYYAREGMGHALIGARQWIRRELVSDPVRSLVTGLPSALEFRTKGQLAIGICADAYADGISFDFICGDEVYGSSTRLREFLETRGQAYVLRVASTFMVPLADGTKLTCARAVKSLLKDGKGWEVCSAGAGSKGQRWYAWAWFATASARHCLLIRRHLATGELAFHYCYVPGGQPITKTRLIRTAGLRWPVEEDFEFGKGSFGLDQCQARLYTAIMRHIVLVMAALAICAITAARLRRRTGTQVPLPAASDQAPPAEPGMIPLTIPETARLIAALTTRPLPPRHIIHWDAWTRRHRARSRWFHQRARLKRDYVLVS